MLFSNVAHLGHYRMADLFVSASDTETQGLTYIEALAAGTKCVVYSTDYTEHVFDNKELGSTFTTKNEMTNEIIDYLKANQFTIPKNLKEKKLIDVSADTFAHKIEDFYQEAIQNKQKTEVNYD